MRTPRRGRRRAAHRPAAVALRRARAAQAYVAGAGAPAERDGLRRPRADAAERCLVDDLMHVKLHMDEGRLDERSLRAPHRTRCGPTAWPCATSSTGSSTASAAPRTRSASSTTPPTARSGSANRHPARRLRHGGEGRRGIGGRVSGRRRALRRQHSQWLYFDRSLIVFQEAWTVLFKPMQRFHWTHSQALSDADEIISATLTSRED